MTLMAVGKVLPHVGRMAASQGSFNHQTSARTCRPHIAPRVDALRHLLHGPQDAPETGSLLSPAPGALLLAMAQPRRAQGHSHPQIYHVREGDWLAHIVRDQGLLAVWGALGALAQTLALNLSIIDAGRIEPGQRIVLPRAAAVGGEEEVGRLEWSSSGQSPRSAPPTRAARRQPPGPLKNTSPLNRGQRRPPLRPCGRASLGETGLAPSISLRRRCPERAPGGCGPRTGRTIFLLVVAAQEKKVFTGLTALLMEESGSIKHSVA